MKNRSFATIINILKYISIYYLSAKMICFAIPKFLFMQFRVSNWETYIPLAEISKTQHMWSFFGRSYNYNLFIGSIEFIVGTLIVFKKTRLIALLISLGLFTNILVLNYEFEIDFALNHIIFDLCLSILLLSYYFKDLYNFFILQGGKLGHSLKGNSNKILQIFPLIFIVLLSISYFIFSYNVKSDYIVDEDIVGAYEIKQIKIDDSIVEFKSGTLAREPLMFLEYDNQFILSIDDTLYKGRYTLKNQEINIYLNTPTKFNMTTLNGEMQNKNAIIGKTENNHNLQIQFELIDSDKNYLNGLYR